MPFTPLESWLLLIALAACVVATAIVLMPRRKR